MCDFLNNLMEKIMGVFKGNKAQIASGKRVLPKGKIDFTFNDPTTPRLKVRMDIPQKPKVMNFSVKGFSGAGFHRQTKEGLAANVYAAMAMSIDMTLKYTNRKIVKWPATRTLNVVPLAGKDLNAYYDRRSLKFFFARNPKTRKTFYTADSNDIVTHELGHAILDTFRPDLWSMQALEAWGFHEAYADIHALLSALHHDEMLRQVIKQTKGNLRSSNSISKLAEEFWRCYLSLDRW